MGSAQSTSIYKIPEYAYENDTNLMLKNTTNETIVNDVVAKVATYFETSDEQVVRDLIPIMWNLPWINTKTAVSNLKHWTPQEQTDDVYADTLIAMALFIKQPITKNLFQYSENPWAIRIWKQCDCNMLSILYKSTNPVIKNYRDLMILLPDGDSDYWQETPYKTLRTILNITTAADIYPGFITFEPIVVHHAPQWTKDKIRNPTDLASIANIRADHYRFEKSVKQDGDFYVKLVELHPIIMDLPYTLNSEIISLKNDTNTMEMSGPVNVNSIKNELNLLEYHLTKQTGNKQLSFD